MKKENLLFLPLALTVNLAIGSAVYSQEAPTAEAIASVEGTYYGTFFCSETGEMAVSLMLEDSGPATGAGNRDMQGIVSFSATVANPAAQLGVYYVSGEASIAGVGVAAISLRARDWIEQPTRFNATGLQFVITQDFLTGTPTMGGCASLTMQRVPS